MSTLTQSPEWQALVARRDELAGAQLRQLFAADPDRGRRLSLEALGIYLDYSKQLIDDRALELLFALARACRLEPRRDAIQAVAAQGKRCAARFGWFTEEAGRRAARFPAWSCRDGRCNT